MKSILIIALTFLSLTHLKAQVPPVASNVKVLGAAYYNATPNPDQLTTLTGYYEYTGTNAEGTSTFQWYRNGGVIAGATSIRYDMQSADIGTTITFRVTPKDNVPNTGTQVTSANSLTGASTTATNITINTLTDNATIQRMNVALNNGASYTVSGTGVVVTIYGDIDGQNGGTIHVVSPAQLIIKGQLVTNNNLDIIVDAGATFSIESGMDVKNGSVLNVSGTMGVTGNINVVQNATFNINIGGSLDVTGSLVTGGNAVLNIEGPVTISGDVTVGSNSQINVDNSLPTGGTLSIGGDLTAGTGSTLNGTGIVTVGGTVTGPAGFATDSQILPIELISFTARIDNQMIFLFWSTASETNNDYFNLERSSDAIHFESIFETTGAGNSSEIRNYETSDMNPLSGISYYRLKQTDYDGKFSYSTIISVNNKSQKIQQNTFSVLPNPGKLGKDDIEILIQINTSNLITLGVYNSIGQKLFSNVYDLRQSGNLITIPSSEFSLRGIYYIVLQNETGKVTRKILIE